MTITLERVTQSEWTGDRIRDARERVGLTQRGLAELLRVSPGAIAHWEQGRTIPNADHQRQLQRILIDGDRSAGTVDERISRLEAEVRELRAATAVLQELVARLAVG